MAHYSGKRQKILRRVTYLCGESRVYLYALKFDNGKEYVGVTSSPISRYRAHRLPSVCNQSKLARAVRKYGSSSFEMYVLRGFTSYKAAYSAERIEIADRGTVAAGYNLSAGGGEGIEMQVSLVGKRFGKLIVKGDTGKRTSSQGVIWLCACACGNKTELSTTALGNVQGFRKSIASCGCASLVKTAPAAVTHGYTGSKTYEIWGSMVARCKDPARGRYKTRLTVGNNWLRFEGFLHDMGECPDGRILIRKNKAEGYSKLNCFWGARSESIGRVRVLTCFGETKSMREWSADARVAVSYTTLRARLNILGWSVVKALTTGR